MGPSSALTLPLVATALVLLLYSAEGPYHVTSRYPTIRPHVQAVYTRLRAIDLNGKGFSARRFRSQLSGGASTGGAVEGDVQDVSNVNASREELPKLPAPGKGNNGTEIKVGESTSLYDLMGPLVVNEDGTVGYLKNWREMSEPEKRTTLRLLTRRNRIRMANLTGDASKLNDDEMRRLKQKQNADGDP